LPAPFSHAARNVIDHVNDPLDFRFFIGKHTWPAAELNTKIRHGVYLPVACSRAIALKQCLGLPKPLWHEVMEMLGGEWDELSASELIKRTDLENSK
jgi:putative transcriptional regulator